jgi:hypothetical protein
MHCSAQLLLMFVCVTEFESIHSFNHFQRVPCTKHHSSYRVMQYQYTAHLKHPAVFRSDSHRSTSCRMCVQPVLGHVTKRRRARDLTIDELKIELERVNATFLQNSSRAQLVDILISANDPRRKRSSVREEDQGETFRQLAPKATIVSEDFTAYYSQQLQLCDSEMNQLLQCMATPLPISFRLNTRCSPFSADVFDARLRATLAQCGATSGSDCAASAEAPKVMTRDRLSTVHRPARLTDPDRHRLAPGRRRATESRPPVVTAGRLTCR